MRRHKMGHGQYRTANDNHHWHCRGIRHISVFHVKQHVDANQDFNKERKCLSSKMSPHSSAECDLKSEGAGACRN